MMNIMSVTREEPLFMKCCFCIPLRMCLQTWAYLKMVADVLAMYYVALVIAVLYSFEHREFFQELSLIHALCLLVIALVVDVGFLVALVIGIFMKSYKILRVFYFYEFYVMTAEFLMITIVCVLILEVDLGLGSLYSVIGILYIMLDVCITMAVKSEMIKLLNKEQYDFTRMRDCRKEGAGTGKFQGEQDCVNV